MGILSWKGGHSYFRVPTRSQTADWESRKVIKTSSNNWKLNNQVFNHINKQLDSIKLSAKKVTNYVSWKQDPMAVATDAFIL